MPDTLILPAIPAVANPELQRALQHKIDHKTKPLGALGRLEALALRLGLIQQSLSPVITAPQIRVFAADHGLARHGVSAYPGEVTAQMVHNFLRGGAAINVFARQHGIALKVVDAGVNAHFEPHPALIDGKIRHGSRDALAEPAMSTDECRRALRFGMALVADMPGNLLLPGEMGIGNTSAASLLLARLGDLPLAQCTGRGTGLDEAGLARKTQILQRVLARHADASAPLDALAALGGLEIAMMAGALIQAASQRRILLLDGFIAGVALLVAERLAPGVRQYAVFAHRSAEPGHRHLLRLLDAAPLLDLDLRLGEGSGAALAYPLLQSACAFVNEMASFSEAGVSGDNHAAP
ncbi:nicotinate-nucleotide--dimethylbenzimidazole phosphoribosyltransferase [Zobellella denitrificans]|jgi:nicotinate-nucleotide--dimethylbenzimidazole phosphoribosyltransferase|uniref:Nicotinate-nucleotide--dimethylbenzimidazole phosphoribosyltransferase n=3 Tax=Zobellella denitrificans TaxID=347534 RepID=A0A291HQX3_9GAMM|nr:nicotinate-nucleotide--dimethylbenzimidazole phosphoribosyltransferase [Zobellella denitrificans]ATG74553.1 nicotinate-nucleotide--dimethylbenzimidazole phosphoribosyltransferase [Zobellella denitrificans]